MDPDARVYSIEIMEFILSVYLTGMSRDSFVLALVHYKFFMSVIRFCKRALN